MTSDMTGGVVPRFACKHSRAEVLDMDHLAWVCFDVSLNCLEDGSEHDS